MRNKHLSKITSELRSAMNAIRPDQASKRKHRVLLHAKPGFIKMITANFQTRGVGNFFSFAALDLSTPEILDIVKDRGLAKIDLDPLFRCLPDPISAVAPLNKDIYGTYKVPPLDNLTGAGVKIVVADTGLSPHPELPQTCIGVDFTGEGSTLDYVGHGTFIAGQITAMGDYPGLAPDVEYHSARIFDQQGFTARSRICEMCDYALAMDAHVVSLSYGSPFPDPITYLAYQTLVACGITVVASGGNEGPEEGTIGFPAGYEEIIAVGAITKDGRLADFSSRGIPGQRPAKPDLTAEGVQIVSLKSPDGDMGEPIDKLHVAASGTSFSAPIVSALTCLIMQAKAPKNLTPYDIREILTDACEKF